MDNEPAGPPGPLADKLERVKGAWSSIAADRMMPDRGWWEEQGQKDEAAGRLLRWEQAIPNRFLWSTVDKLDAEIAQPLRLWASDPRPANLLIFGPLGIGKTYAAVAAARLRHDAGDEVHFWPVVELLDGLRPGSDISESLFGQLTRDADLLILDDLGREKPSEWVRERLYAIVNRRWMDEKPTVATTTLQRPALIDAAGDSFVSRLCDGLIVPMDGSDRRRWTS
jgi:DNA replication protein DnaC